MGLAGYYELACLSDEVKAKNGIKCGAIVPRLDCIRSAGNYTGLNPFVKTNGKLYFYLCPVREVVQSKSKRFAEYCLIGNNLNFGSIYEFAGQQGFAYSTPCQRHYIGEKKLPNPLFPFREDLYLLLFNTEYTRIEVLIIEGGRNFAEHHLQQLIEGHFDLELEDLRREAKMFHNYKGL